MKRESFARTRTFSLIAWAFGFLLWAPATLGAGRVTCPAGALQLTLEKDPDGVKVVSLRDREAKHEFLAEPTMPLFVLHLRDLGSGEAISPPGRRGPVPPIRPPLPVQIRNG